MKIFILSLLFTLSLFAIETKDGEYYISTLNNGGQSLDSYYDTLGIPNLYVSSACRKNCKKNCCYDVLRNRDGEVVKSFSRSDDVSELARSRYRDKSYLLYSHTYGSKKNRRTKVILLDNSKKRYRVPRRSYGAYDRVISKDAKIIEVAREGIYINGVHTLEKKNFESAKIENDLDGNIGVVGVDDDSRGLFVSNLKEYKFANIALAFGSDENGIIAVYPAKDSVYAVAYNLINIYNKGLMGAKVDFTSGEVKAGWIYNYEGQNIGFYPQIYIKDKHLYVLTHDSSNDRSVHFSISAKEYASISETTPLRDGFEDEAFAGFVVGAGLSYLAWEADSDVTDSDDVEYASADYDIANTLYKKIWLQGRIGDTQLAVSYMQNEAEKVGGLTKKASEVLSFFVDFNNLISSSSVLRIAYESADINGITTFHDNGVGATNITTNQKVEFKSTIDRFSFLVMREKGLYWGFEYAAFETPSAVGFSNSSKDVEYYGLDEKFALSNYELVIGYDTASYAKRYETNFNKFYIEGLFGLGISTYDMSSEFEKNIENQSGKKIVDSSYSFVVDAEIEVGYLYQQRFKTLKGFGYSLDVGLKARGIYTGTGQSDDSDDTIEADELTMEMSRSDIWYGPFINYNIVF